MSIDLIFSCNQIIKEIVIMEYFTFLQNGYLKEFISYLWFKTKQTIDQEEMIKTKYILFIF